MKMIKQRSIKKCSKHFEVTEFENKTRVDEKDHEEGMTKPKVFFKVSKTINLGFC